MMLNLQSYTTTVLNEKCDILGVKTYFNPTYFQGGQPVPPQPPGSTPLGRQMAVESKFRLVYIYSYNRSINSPCRRLTELLAGAGRAADTGR